MSQQRREVRDRLERMKAQGLVLPEQKDPRQLWILIVMDPSDNAPGSVFITHGKNYNKFKARRSCKVVAHSWDLPALQEARRKIEDQLGPNYRPLVSARPDPNKIRPQSAEEIIERELADLPGVSSASLDDIE